MPDLPTITVTANQAEKILDAFTGFYDQDGAPLAPAQAYRRWSKERIRDYVIARRSQILEEQLKQSRSSQLAAIRTDMDQL